MTCAQLAKLLLEQPNAETLQVVAKVGDDWSEVLGLRPTGRHRNAITFDLAFEAVATALMVEPDSE